MQPLFVFADSDIDEEELKPVLLRLQKKLCKTHKTRERRKTDKKHTKLSVTEVSGDVNQHVLMNGGAITDSMLSHKAAEAVPSNQYNTSIQLQTVSPNVNSRKRREHTISDVATKKSRCSLCCSERKQLKGKQKSSSKQPVKHSCLCESGQIPRTAKSSRHSDFTSRVVALDCEFVGVGPGKISALGRCTVVDYSGTVLLDLYARPEEPITDYRTRWSGIRPKDLISAIPFECARRVVCDLLKDKIVIGHAVFNDFRVLRIHHPPECVRDTASYKPLREMAASASSQGMSLKRLSKALLGRDIQGSEHCSTEDAVAALDLYKLVQSEWEQQLVARKTKRSQKAIRSAQRLFPDVSYLGDEFWPSALLDTPTI